MGALKWAKVLVKSIFGFQVSGFRFQLKRWHRRDRLTENKTSLVSFEKIQVLV
jgi:hypothetical protein